MNSMAMSAYILKIIVFLNILVSYLGLYSFGGTLFYLLIPINCLGVFLLGTLDKRQAIFMSVSFLVLAFFLLKSSNTEYIILFSFFVICSRVDFGSLGSISFRSMAALLVIFIILRYPESEVYFRGDGGVRYDLGFNNPNILSKYAFSLIIVSFVINKKYLAVFIAVLFFYITGTRTLLYTIILYPLISFYLNKLAYSKYVFKIPVMLIFPLLTLFSVLLAEYSKDYEFIDFALSFRPMHWVNYLEEYPITLYGHIWKELEFYALDNSFLQIIVRLGLLGSIVFSAFYFYLVKRLFQEGNNRLIFCLTATMVYSVFENMLKFPLFNIATVFSVVYIYKSNNREVNEKD